MKRHRFLNLYIDSSRNFFGGDKAGPLFEKYKQEQREVISQKYGSFKFEEKFERWLSVPKPVLSVVDEHSHLLQDIEDSYISGNLYSALTGACCLGERIFNQIILRVKESFQSNGQYKLVYKKDSINDWNLGIETLLAWEIIDEGTEKKYRRLSTLRNESVHFQNKEQDLIPMSKEAIVLINEIVSDLFEMKKGKEFLIWFEVPGELYLKKDAERLPFVQSFFIPCAPLVGYKHVLEGIPDFKLKIMDNHTYSGEEVSDEEFVKLRNDYNKKVSGEGVTAGV